jgi:hypothetical protein
MRSNSAFAAIGLWCACALGCSSAPAVESAAAADDPAARAFLEAHNRARAGAEPPASPPLPPLRWSAELAAHAAEVAARCEFEHGQGDHGENIAARTSAAPPERVVASWVQERADWDAGTNRCADGKVCTHYTQVVWRASRELGCASRRCERGSPFRGAEWHFTVCNYSPAGNRNGERPY